MRLTKEQRELRKIEYIKQRREAEERRKAREDELLAKEKELIKIVKAQESAKEEEK